LDETLVNPLSGVHLPLDAAEFEESARKLVESILALQKIPINPKVSDFLELEGAVFVIQLEGG
jgi:hypothetical protein